MPTHRASARAERDIRMTKVKQKIAGCVRTTHYAAVYCRLSSYLQSMAQQGYNPLVAINIALNGNAAMMIEKPAQNNPDNQNQDEGRVVTGYLRRIVEESNRKPVTRSHFSRFDNVNIYLISQILDQNRNLWLKPATHELKKFYQPAVFAAVHCFCEDKKVPPEIGEKYKNGKDEYEVVETDPADMERGVRLSYIGKKNGKKGAIRTTSLEYFYDEYIKLTFPHKFAVIAQINDFEQCVDSKEFPYTRIKKSERKDNTSLSAGSTFFVASDYETIQEYLFDRGTTLDVIIFIGNNKYDHQVQQDIDRGKLKQAVFIGEEKPGGISHLLKWCWTLPEYLYFKEVSPAKIELPIKKEVKNEQLSQQIKQFLEYIKQVKQEHQLDLSRLSNFISYCYPLVIPTNSSRLVSRIDDLERSFEKKLGQIASKFYAIGQDETEVCSNLRKMFQNILGQFRYERNAKSQALKQLDPTDYLLVPKRQTLQVWQDELIEINWRNTEPVSLKKFKKLRGQESVTILGLEDKEFFHAIRTSNLNVTWLLYTEEYKACQGFSTRCDNEQIKEYQSSDRERLSGIPYLGELKTETTDELIERIFSSQEDDEHREYSTSWNDHIEKKIIFSDNSDIELSANSTVILINSQDGALKYKVADLMRGDNVRIYENQHKEMLFDIACQSDAQGKFRQITDHSELWKSRLRTHCDSSEEKTAVIADKCGVSQHTVTGWLREGSGTKFPQSLEKLKFILGEDYSEIADSRRRYNSIMIALGRDLSDEISEYIISEEKGGILEKFNDDTIRAISESNMPIKKIIKIETVAS